MALWLVDAVLLAALVPALVTDLRFRRIPHWITLPALLAGLAIAGASFGLGDSWTSPGLRGAIAGAASAYLFFAMFVLLGGMGNGDANLMAAIGALLGFPPICGAAAAVALVGGVQGVVALLARTRLGRVVCARIGFKGTDQPEFARAVPYGVAIVFGTALFRVWQHVVLWEYSHGP